MPQVTILVDEYKLLTQATGGAVVAASVGDFAGACLAARQALHGGAPVTIHVRHRAVAAWLRNLSRAYGAEHVTYRVYTPQEALRERSHLAAPSDVTAQEIIQSGLLDERITSREGQGFWSAILEHFCGEAFSYPAIPLGSLGDLLNDWDAKRWQDALRRPLVARALRDRFYQWERVARNDSVRAIIHRLSADPAALRRDLACYRVLISYPTELGASILGDTWEQFQTARVDPTDVAPARAYLESILPRIEYYLTETCNRATSAADVAALAQHVSGCLVEEFEALDKLLRAHPTWLTPDLLDTVEQRFAPIQSGIRSRMAALRRLPPPPFPSKPEPSWPAHEWLEWAWHSYLPYYAWLDAQGKRDDAVASYAFAFADWLYDHFIEIKNGEPDLFAFSALYNQRQAMGAPEAVTLVIIADNLGMPYVEHLRRLFNDRGFSMDEMRPLLSLIPSTTDVSKPCLISGSGDVRDVPDNGYADLVRGEWGKILHDDTALYLANVAELKALDQRTHRLYVLNYTAVDAILHEDNRYTGIPHIDSVYERLAALTDAVAEFSRRFDLDDRIVVHVIADHGSTRIPQGTINVVDKKFYKGLALDKHHRFIGLSDEKFAALPQVVSKQCYVIDRARFKTTRHYLIGREYYRFLDTTENFYVHGGLTPEEMVVPFARFRRVALVPVAPTLQILGAQFRFEVLSRVPLELGNPNAFPLDHVTARVIDLEGEEVRAPDLGPKETVKIDIPVRFRKAQSAGRTRSIIIRLRYECQGRSYGPQDYTFQVTMKALQEATDDDTDL